ncbi:hypothetical protein EX30DRAFT_146861 [Ascodesmis nigricans]|uniref:Protein PBN1 n=1 Tax=Ascodesmis nigricans TaxID=341454 RepID=A0A4S2N1R6_9PEZI|nr:hypothetical protein EX30DRAFT_146861 [Ascodesmis nigricans]
MHTIWYLRTLFLSAILTPVLSNVEKVVFLAPPPSSISTTSISPQLPHLSPQNTKLSTSWTTSFTETGAEHWLVLDNLNPAQRYEARICWSATQPTDFWMRIYTPEEIAAERGLVESVVRYVEDLEVVEDSRDEASGEEEKGRVASRLYLRAWAKAAYFSNDVERMEKPESVDVEIILDPFLLNVFPESLLWTARYIVAVAVFAWFCSGWVCRLLAGLVPDQDKEKKRK